MGKRVVSQLDNSVTMQVCLSSPSDFFVAERSVKVFFSAIYASACMCGFLSKKNFTAQLWTSVSQWLPINFAYT